ncbi:MAG: hypothetical protein RXN78_06725 [Vulcanisaeta sp.]
MGSCEDEYVRLARYCAERESELARYKRLSYEYLQEIKRLTLLLSATLSHLKTLMMVTNYRSEAMESEVRRLEEELRVYMEMYVLESREVGGGSEGASASGS